MKAIEAKLAGAPPASVSVALRADSASEGRRDVVRAMFEVAWWPMLGAFSQVRFVACCLELVAVTVVAVVAVVVAAVAVAAGVPCVFFFFRRYQPELR